jgi:TetR/AcrR family transcriptional regulator, regulator of cefoperazone and chloramphenicol sensitivity
MNKLSLSPANARYRILDAAGEVFAEFGFQKATVRKICHRAGVNLASINYYFGEKEKLYFEVLKYGHEISVQKYPLEFGLNPDLSPEERLQSYIRLFLFRMFDKGKPAWFGKLIAKEMTEPTQAFDRLVKEVIRPLGNLLASIVRELAGNQMEEDKVRLCCASIIGQCLHYHHSRPIITRLFPKNIYTPEGIDQITKHIAQFSLNGLKHS